jgi:hypothetical protein
MGRPKGFIREEVLEKAMPAFWKRGFADTSLRSDVLNDIEIYASRRLATESPIGVLHDGQIIRRLGAFLRLFSHHRSEKTNEICEVRFKPFLSEPLH